METVDVKTLDVVQLVSEATIEKCDLAYHSVEHGTITLDRWRQEWFRQYVNPKVETTLPEVIENETTTAEVASVVENDEEE